MPALALLYDVHGNRLALEAVLEDARAAGATRYLLGGDYGLFGPWPAEAVATLEALPDAIWIRGNVDRWTAHPDQAGDDELLQDAIAACRGDLGPERVTRLGELPGQAVRDGTRYCHASPLDDMHSFLPEEGDTDDELLAGTSERRIVFGHTHLQFRRVRQDGVELINPGSVGMPLDGDHRAAYALVHEHGAVELRRVAYDHEASAVAVLDRFGERPWSVRTAHRLRSASL